MAFLYNGGDAFGRWAGGVPSLMISAKATKIGSYARGAFLVTYILIMF
jgi:hypothetical protein